MSNVQRSREKTEEKPDTPLWPIRFSCQNSSPTYQEIRVDLLALSRGSAKGADLLYCLLNKARWEVHNQHLDRNVKAVTFQFGQSDVEKCLAKAGKTISQGSYSSYLRLFRRAGYIENQPYSKTFIVHLSVIEAAFANPPKKEHQEASGKPVSKCQSVKIDKSGYENLLGVCIDLTQMCQLLNSRLQQLTHLCQSLTQSTSTEAASEAASVANPSLQSDDSEISKNLESIHTPEPATLSYSAESQLGTTTYSQDLTREAPAQYYTLCSWLWSNHGHRPSKLLILLSSVFAPSEISLRMYAVEQYKLEAAKNGCSIAAIEIVSEAPENALDAAACPEWMHKLAEVLLIPLTEKFVGTEGKQNDDNGYRTSDKPTQTSIVLTPEEQRISDWYCRFLAISPKVTETYQRHCRTLIPYVQSYEDMASLEKVARNYLKKILPKGVSILHLGNFTNNTVLNSWLAEYKQETIPPASPETVQNDPLVLWRRVEHPRSRPLLYWWLYELMPLSEAREYGYRDIIPPSDRNEILNNHFLLQSGQIEIPPEARQNVA